MKLILHVIFSYISFCNFLTLSSAVAISESGSEIVDSSSSSIRIKIADNNNVVNLLVPNNGELASKDFPDPIIVRGATVQSDRKSIRCFFLLNHGYPDGGDFEGPFGEVTIPFTPGQPLKDPAPIRYKTAYRIYCYDGTEDDANDDTFAIFIQNAYNQQGLIRVRVTAGAKDGDLYAGGYIRYWAILDLKKYPQYAKLRRAVHAVALVGQPSQRYKSNNYSVTGPFCRAYFGKYDFDSFWYNEKEHYQTMIQDRRLLTHLVCYDPRTEEEGYRLYFVKGERTLPYSTKFTNPPDAIDVEAIPVDDDDDNYDDSGNDDNATGPFIEGQE